MIFDARAATEATATAAKEGSLITLQAYVANEPYDENEYCLFLKPELTELGDHMQPVLQLIAETLSRFEQRVVAAVAVGAAYLDRHGLMREHYGVIDRISREGIAAAAPAARERLRVECPDYNEASYDALGAHQFLERYPFFTASAVAVIYDNLQNHKLGGGTHCVEMNVRGRKTLLFNGFHPEQLDRYITPGASLFALVVRTSLPWRSIRQGMTGATHPAKATAGSIRALLLAQKTELGLKEVSPGKNGIHVSAGPVEGMAEIRRFFSDFDAGTVIPHDETSFGRGLTAKGISPLLIDALARNIAVRTSNSTVPAFDLTEETDAKEALEMLSGATVVSD
jgi:nucleoside diphosphate kinase